MRSKGKPMTMLMIIERVKYFYDEIKTTDKYRNSNKKLPVRT
jgi:hypothetical protein